MHALLEVSPSASNEDLRHAVRQKSAEYDADGVCDMLQRIVDAKQFLLSQPQDLYGLQLAIPSCCKFHSRSTGGQCALTDSGPRELGDKMVAVEDLQLVQDFVPALHTEEILIKDHSVVKAHARNLENEILCLRVQPSRGCVGSQETR